jgi:hypothetical protein
MTADHSDIPKVSRRDGRTDNRAGIRKTALILAAVAVAFYLGFILIGVLSA